MGGDSAADRARLLRACVDLLSEISRDPAVYGDSAAALALGTLCLYADPRKVVTSSDIEAPNLGSVVLAVAAHLAADKVRSLGLTPSLLMQAATTSKPFLSKYHPLLIKAGQTFPVVRVLERARARAEQEVVRSTEEPSRAPLPDPSTAPAKERTAQPLPVEQPVQQTQSKVSQTERETRPSSSPDPRASSVVSVSKASAPTNEDVAVAKTVAVPSKTSEASSQPPRQPPSPAGPIDSASPLHTVDCVLGDRDTSLSTEDRAVFRGTLAGQGTPVTLIEVKSTWMLNQNYVTKMGDWIGRLKMVDGPNAARVLGFYQPPGRIFVVQELLDGMTLDKILAQGPMEEHEVLSKLEALATGLRSYHTAGVIHRGLRPDRILLDRKGDVLIFDPAIPRAPRSLGEEETLKDKGLKGEVRYMAPELCLGQDDASGAADIYSLGLILCEMLLGEQNLQRIAGESVKFWLNWHVDLYKKAIPLSDIDPEISPELSDFVVKMLEKRLKNRYSDASQLLSDLNAYRTGARKALRQISSREGTGGSGRNLLAAEQKARGLAAVPLRTMALASAVFMMFLIVVAAAVFKMQGPDQGRGDPSPLAEDPCKRIVEDALTAFRREDFDSSTKRLQAMSAEKCGPASEVAANGLKRDIQKAHMLKSSCSDAMKRGKESESSGQTGPAISIYLEAAKAYRELSALIQQPDRPLPDELAKRLGALEPVRLLEDAKQALKNLDPVTAKTLTYRLIDNYPNSSVIREAEDFVKRIAEVVEKRRVYMDSFEKGRDHDHASRHMEAAQCLWQAKTAYEDMVRACGNPTLGLPSDFRDKLFQVLPKIWSIRTPVSEQKIVDTQLVVEVQIPEKFFKEVIVEDKSIPVRGEFMTFKLTELKEGSQLLEISAISVMGLRSTKKVPFHFQLPPEVLPQVKINSFSSSDSGVSLVLIEYKDETYTVQSGWVAPDGQFTVTSVNKETQTITIMTPKKKKIVITF